MMDSMSIVGLLLLWPLSEHEELSEAAAAAAAVSSDALRLRVKLLNKSDFLIWPHDPSFCLSVAFVTVLCLHLVGRSCLEKSCCC